jgi:hypothetical protein
MDKMFHIFDIIPEMFNGIIQITEKVADWTQDVATIGERLQHLAVGIVDLGEGLGDEIIGFPQAVEIGTVDMATFIVTTIIYVGELIYCTMRSLQNFPSCFIYYAIEIFGILIYLPVKLFFWILGLQSIEDSLWGIMYHLDEQFYKLTGGHNDDHSKAGYHFLHYPCWIIDKCYSCKDGSGRPLADKAKYVRETEKTFKDFSPDGQIGHLVYDPLQQIIKGAGEIASVFMP